MMDLDNLRAVRATLMVAEEDLRYEEGVTGLTAMRDIRGVIRICEALLPVVTEAEAEAEFADNPERLAELKSKWQWM